MPKIFLEVNVKGETIKLTAEGTADEIRENRVLFAHEGHPAEWLCVPVETPKGPGSVAPPTFGKPVCLVNIYSLLMGSGNRRIEGYLDVDRGGLKVTLTAYNLLNTLEGVVEAIRVFGKLKEEV